MSQIQLFNDTWHIRNQRLPVWTVVGDLLYFDNTGWHLRTAVTDPINGYVAVLDAWTDTWVISVANWVTTWSWGWSSNQVIYEDITNPAKTTNVSWGKRVGKIKWAAWWASLQYEWDSFFIDCFDNNEWDANNGLSIKNWTTVLGQDIGEAGDPAKLLSDREIPMDGKSLTFREADDKFTKFLPDWDIYMGWAAIQMGYTQTTQTWYKVVQKQAKWANSQLESLYLTSADNVWYGQNRDGIWTQVKTAAWAWVTSVDWETMWIVPYVYTDYQNVWTGTTIQKTWLYSQTGDYYLWSDDITGLWQNINHLPPVLSTAVPLGIVESTGQIGRMAKDLYFSFQQDWNLDSFDNTTMWYRYSLFWHTFIRTTSTTHSAGTINLPSTANSWMLEFEYWTDIEYRTNLDFLKQATIIKFNWNTLPTYHNHLRESFKDLWTTQSWWSKPRVFMKDSFKVILTPWVYNITSEPLLVVQNSITNPPSNADLEANFWWVWYQIKATPF